jgi:hypothetical protein
MLQTMAFALAGVIPAAVDTGLFVSTCSVFQQDGNIGTSGAPSGNYNVPVIQHIACMDAVPRELSIEATEMREIKEIQSKGYRHVLLAGNYYADLFPLIQQGLQATVTDPDGTTTYNLFGVEPDSQNRMTRLHLEVISV